jgi:hypothetical protein
MLTQTTLTRATVTSRPDSASRRMRHERIIPMKELRGSKERVRLSAVLPQLSALPWPLPVTEPEDLIGRFSGRVDTALLA